MARERREDARRLLAQDIDPGLHRKVQDDAKQQRAANSFESVAREWFAKNKPTWADPTPSKLFSALNAMFFCGSVIAPLPEYSRPNC